MRKTERAFNGNSGRASAALALLLLLVAPLSAQEGKRRGVTPEDYFAFEFLSDPRLSPDGKSVAYVVTTVDQRQNRRQSQIWLAATDGSRPPRQLTTSPQSASSPRWSPDGRALAFLSARPTADGGPSTQPAAQQNTPQGTPTPTHASTPLPGATVPQATPPPAQTSTPAANVTATTPGVPSALQTTTAGAGEPPPPRAQVWLLSLDGGEARRLTNFRNGVGNFDWSPDGRRLVLTSRTGPSDARPPSSDVRHYKHPSYKFNDTGWFDDKRGHLFVVDVSSGAAKQITFGEDWNDTDPQWSPDSSTIAFVSDRTHHAFDESRNTDVFIIDSEGGPTRKISDHDEEDYSPRWSPDGKQIAFLGRLHETDHPKIFLASSSGGAPSRNLSPALDLIPSNLVWADEGRALYFETGVRGEQHLFRVDAKDGKLTQVTRGARAVRSVDIADRARRMVYAANDFTHLDNLYTANLDGAGERKLTSLNARLWSQLLLADVERLTYKGADGWDVDGFMVKPVGWQEGRKYPMILSVHGGPAGQYGVDWFQEFQVYAARGWAVFYCNPRGSTGYGQKFERGIEGQWGGNDYTDIMNGVEAALAKYPWVDRERLGVTGGSYGGYMTNWIVGHTDIFKAAVTLRSISDFISDEGTRDGAYGHREDFGGYLFDKFDTYWDRSPLKYARNVKTPTLILHSDNDYRVPLEQGEQWFRALQHFGVPSELVIFPRENHNLTRTGEPKHLVESLNWQLYWFERYLDGNESAVPPDAR
ncbi:MAG TPA: prolyl oligopeptidase family serine peptidase [Pyrinomonadaceae bacterium]|jgi:dipeptidyl aminopeptidase/acylaminoacyl peptidase|nr:prolyl oligopeptidase family serine peptidase [Pyrinomonadaceae bacterium]